MGWDRRLFRILLVFLPTQLSLHFWPEWAYLFGIRVDYLSPALYFTDFIIVLLLVVYFFSYNIWGRLNVKIILVIGIALVLNIFYSYSPIVSFLAWARLLLHAGLGLYVYERAREVGRDIPKFLSVGIFYTFLIATIQFVKQESVGGLLYWIGERQISSSTPGIARESFFGEVVLRPYATFPHPNAMAGYALLAIVLIWAHWGTRKSAPIILAGTGIILISFSQAAWMVGVLVVVMAIARRGRRRLIGPRALVSSAFIVSFVLSTLPSTAFDNYYLAPEIGGRLDLNFIAGHVISGSYIAGVGLNNFVIALSSEALVLRSYLAPMRMFWLQPVHNIFLLAFSELGFVGIGVLLYLLARAYLISEKSAMMIGVVVIVVTGMGDHYWITLGQTRLLAVIFIALGLRDNISPA